MGSEIRADTLRGPLTPEFERSTSLVRALDRMRLVGAAVARQIETDAAGRKDVGERDPAGTECLDSAGERDCRHCERSHLDCKYTNHDEGLGVIRIIGIVSQ